MHKAALHQQVTQLIGQDELRQAAEVLASHWQPLHEALYQATLAQIRRLHTLEQKQLKGLISEDNAAVEHARITDALLSIASQLQNDSPGLPEQWEEAEPKPPAFRKWWPAGILALGALALIIWMASLNRNPGTFHLTLNVQQQKDAMPVTGGKIKLILGDFHLPAKDLNADGQVIFDEIPDKYLGDSLQVIPVDLPYRVKTQSATFAKASGKVTVSMIPKPDSILWRGSVVDSRNLSISGAEIDVEGGTGVATTDSMGNFKLALPLRNNSYVRVRVRIDGRLRSDQRLTLDKDKSQTLMIDPQ